MPLKRTPPMSPAVFKSPPPFKTPPAHHLSEPNLNSSNDFPDDCSSSNITSRIKRKRMEQENQDSAEDFNHEITVMIKELKREQSSFLSSMQSSLQEIKSQYTKLQESVDFTSTKYDEVMNKMLQYEAERRETNIYIKKLEDRVDQLEKQAKNTCFEIKNIPKKTNESKMDLVSLVVNISKVLGPPITETEIKDVFRIHSTTATNNTVIVDLTTVLKKETVLQAARTYNKENRNNKLNTTSLHIDGPKLPVYISDNLPAKTRKLFFLTRQFAALHHFKHCWSAHGKVYIRKEDGAKRYCINSEGDLSKILEI